MLEPIYLQIKIVNVYGKILFGSFFRFSLLVKNVTINKQKGRRILHTQLTRFPVTTTNMLIIFTFSIRFFKKCEYFSNIFTIINVYN